MPVTSFHKHGGSGVSCGVIHMHLVWAMFLYLLCRLHLPFWILKSSRQYTEYVLCLVAQSYPTLCDPMDCNPSGSSVHGDSAGKDTGVDYHALLHGIFPTQGLNPGLPHCRQILYQLSHQGSPRKLEWVAYPFSRGSSQPRTWTGVSCIAGGFFTSWATKLCMWVGALQNRVQPDKQGRGLGRCGLILGSKSSLSL